jgi:hypothetical protein
MESLSSSSGVRILPAWVTVVCIVSSFPSGYSRMLPEAGG